MNQYQSQTHVQKTIQLIEAHFPQPSQSSQELYKRIFKSKDKTLVNLFTEKACKVNELDSSIGLLRVKIVSDDSNLQLDQQVIQINIKDLENLFGLFGKIEKIIIKQKGSAFIQYSLFLEAFFAQKALNNLKIQEHNCYLQVIYLQVKVQLCQVKNPSQSLKFDISEKFLDNQAKFDPSFQYYCKFITDIYDQNFSVTERVLGQRGCNILRVHFLISRQVEGADIQNDLDLKVGEQNGRTFVLIQGQCYEKFSNACKLIHELIANIYEEYKKYCEFQKIPYPTDLRLQKEEKYQNEAQLIFIDNQ